MNRRTFLTGAGSMAAASATGARPPNLVFLLTDDHRWDTLGAMGNPVIQTPHLDALSRQGVTFENNFVTTAICMTSRASIFTGLHERSHGISSFAQTFSPEAYRNIYPVLLRAAGYRTGFVGKWGVGDQMPRDRSDYFQGFPGQGHYFVQRGGRQAHLTDVMGEQAVEFLEGCEKSRPFCLSVSFKAPHVQDEDLRQFLYAPEYRDLYKDVRIPVPRTCEDRYFDELPDFLRNSESRRRWGIRFATNWQYQESVKGYYRLITGVDAVVGRIRSTLERLGLAGDTVIVFTGDNGFFLGEHGLAGKWYMYEESIRTPLVVHDPRQRGSWGTRRREMSLNIDIAPTLLAFAGLAAPLSMEGRSLLPLLGKSSSPAWRRDWYYSHLFEHAVIPKSEGVRTGDWKYFRFLDTPEPYEALFHVSEDPLEERNLAGAGASRAQLARLKRRLDEWRAALDGWRPGAPWKDPEGDDL